MGCGSPNFDKSTENIKREQRISGISQLSETHKYMNNSFYEQSLFPVLTNSAYDQQCLSTGTNYASNQQFVITYTKTQIILLSYYPLSYQTLHAYSEYFHTFWVTTSSPNQKIYTNKDRICVRYRLLYIQGVGETKQFSGPNPHVDPHSDVGAVTQMDLSKEEENINGTEQVNGTGQRKGPIRSQQFREE